MCAQGLRVWVQKCAQERWKDNWSVAPLAHASNRCRYNELSQSMYLDLTDKQTSIDSWGARRLFMLS